MTEAEYLELLTLSVVVIPNMDPREYDVQAAAKRQMELFGKAAQPYAYYQGEVVEPVTTEE